MPLSERVAKRYQELVLAAGDEETLRLALSTAPAAVAMSFEQHLKAIEMQSLEVLTQWRGGAAFIGHQVARRARNTFPETGISPAWLPAVPKSFRGYFENFWRSGERQRAVDFYDVDTGRTVSGSFSPELRKRVQAPDFTLTLGRGTTQYRIDTLEEQIDPPRYTLIDIHG